MKAGASWQGEGWGWVPGPEAATDIAGELGVPDCIGLVAPSPDCFLLLLLLLSFVLLDFMTSLKGGVTAVGCHCCWLLPTGLLSKTCGFFCFKSCGLAFNL